MKKPLSFFRTKRLSFWVPFQALLLLPKIAGLKDLCSRFLSCQVVELFLT
jgi:hypothetical protein